MIQFSFSSIAISLVQLSQQYIWIQHNDLCMYTAKEYQHSKTNSEAKPSQVKL